MSYNRILKQIGKFTENHLQINSFGDGFNSDYNTFIENNNKGYYLFVKPSTITVQNENVTYNLQIICSDIIPKSDEQTIEREILSDTAQILFDLTKFFKLWNNNNQMWISPNQNYNLSPFNNSGGEYTSGWQLNVTIQTPIIYNTCDIPLKDITPQNLPSIIPDFEPPLTCQTLGGCQIIIDLQDDLNNVEQNITIVENNITNINQTINNIQQNITEITQDVTIIEQDITVIENNITNINNNIFNIEGDLTELEETLIDIQDNMLTCETVRNCDIITDIQTDINDLQNEVANIKLPILEDDFFREFNASANGWKFIGLRSTGVFNSATPQNNSYRNQDAEDDRIGIHNLYRANNTIRNMGIFRQFDGLPVTSDTLRLEMQVKYPVDSSDLNDGNLSTRSYFGFLNDFTTAADNTLTFWDNSVWLTRNLLDGTMFFSSASGGNGTTVALSPFSFGTTDWHTIVIELNSSSATLFIDGVQISQITQNIPSLTNVGISHSRATGSSGSNGVWIDKVKLTKI